MCVDESRLVGTTDSAPGERVPMRRDEGNSDHAPPNPEPAERATDVPQLKPIRKIYAAPSGLQIISLTRDPGLTPGAITCRPDLSGLVEQSNLTPAVSGARSGSKLKDYSETRYACQRVFRSAWGGRVLFFQ